MDANRFDTLARTATTPASRRAALGAAVAGGVLGALGLRGVTPAVRAAQGQTCTLAFTATVRTGPNAGKQLVSGAQPGELTGQLSFTLSDSGDIENGELTLPNGATAPVVGQATGHSFQIRTPLGNELVLVAVGVGEGAIADCAGAIDGLITGPARGDMGDFHAEATGAGASGGATGGKEKDKDKKKDRDTTGAAGAVATVAPANGAGDKADKAKDKDKDKGAGGAGNGNGNGSGSGAATTQTCPQNQTFCAIGNGYCADLQTDATNCGACGNQCPVNNCANGVCITSDQQTCNPPLGFCNGTCVDLTKDVFNCGACGVACAIDQDCVDGACAAAQLACQPDETLCGDVCTNLMTDAANCGACGAACTGSEVCEQGACTLTCAGTICNGLCVDTTTDSRNCGGCGVACPTDQICQNSACIGAGDTGGVTTASTGAGACAEGLTDCGGTCIDLMADDLNCSACGARCNLGEHCVLGVCTAPCAPGLTLCGDVCADLQNDPNNCGACYTVCPSGQCGIGICVEVVGPSASCQPGYTLCNGACVDLTSDLFNCGSCGYSCNIGKSPSCQGSVCYNGGVCPDNPGGAC